MSQYLSNKIVFFHCLGVFIVLYMHAFLPNIEYSAFNEIQNFTAKVFCRVFNPMYFSIAGYLFFVSIKNGKIGDFIYKIKRRFHSLLIPYLVCNILGAFFVLIVNYLGLPSKNVEDTMSYYNTHNIILFLFYKPALGQLWFIRDLIFISLLSYPLYIALRNKKIGLLFIMAILTLVLGEQLKGLLLSLCSFSVGAFCAIHKIDVLSVKFKNGIYIWGVLYLVLFGTIIKEPNICLITICSWGLFLSLWLLYDKIHSDFAMFNKWGGYGFFVYVFHDPLMSITKWSLYDFYKDSFLLQLLIYVSLPILFFVFLSFIAKGMKLYCTLLYNTLTGCR